VRHTNGVRGRPRLLHFDDIDYLRQIIRARPDWFLDELLELLETNRFISAHYSTIHRELVRSGISTKKLKKIALERNENLRADYIRHMAQYSPEQLGFLDEVSKDERTSARSRGRSRKGTRAVKKGVFVRGWRFSAEGLLTIDGMIANTVVEGSMTRDHFLQYLEFTVVRLYTVNASCIHSHFCSKMPLCAPFPGYLSVLVMDNARIHHGEGILELAAQFRSYPNPLMDTLLQTCFRNSNRVPTALFSRFEPDRGSVLKSESLYTKTQGPPCKNRRRHGIRLDANYGGHYRLRCSWILHTRRIFLGAISKGLGVQRKVQVMNEKGSDSECRIMVFYVYQKGRKANSTVQSQP